MVLPLAEPGDRADRVHAAHPTAMSARRRFTMDVWTAVTAPAVLLAAVLFVVPLIVIVVRSLTDPDPSNYADAVSSTLFRRSLVTTLRMGVCVAIFCVVVSYPYAWVLSRGTKAIRMILTVALFGSFWTSSLIRTYAWQILLGNAGVINRALIGFGVIRSPLPLIHNDFAVYVGMSQVLAPFAVLTLLTQLNSIRPELELAALGMGARPITVFWRIVFPLSLPGAAAGSVLVFVLALGFYITPAILGSSRRLYLGSLIMQEINVSLRTGLAAAFAVVVLVVVLAILLVAGRIVGVHRLLGLGGETR